MTTLPSKELLSEVLKRDVPLNSKGFNIMTVKENIISYGIEFSFKKEINIYELEHKCKVWALNKGYQFRVYYQADGSEEWEVGLATHEWDLFRAKNCIELCQLIMEQIK